MTSRAARVATGAFAVMVLFTLVSGVIGFTRPAVPGVASTGLADLSYMFNVLGFGAAAVLVARRHPQNLAWMGMTAAGVAGAFFSIGVQYTVEAALLHPGGLPGAAGAIWVTTWLFDFLPASIAFIFMVFPTGRPVSARWGRALWLVPAALAASVIADSLTPSWPQNTVAGPQGVVKNPLALHGMDGLLAVLHAVSGVLLALAFVLALASLVTRYKRGDSQERHQLRWFLFAAPLTPLGFAFYPLVTSPSTPPGVFAAALLLQLLASAGLPLALGIAILKYRLYDIDLVISRTLVYGALAVFVTVVYVGIVVGMGRLVGGGDRPNLVLSVLATAIVAMAFQPVHQRLQRFSNRVVYGRRATPYEVLAQFSAHVADTYAADEVLPRMARLLGEATGARGAQVWVRRQDRMAVAARWPELGDETAHAESVAIDGSSMPELVGADRAVAIRYQGELLGALSTVRRSGEPMTPVERGLMDDLAQQAGLVLRNVRLTAELMQRLDELRSSRQRLVAAQDDERRRLERDLHDGAQQGLVALKIKMNLVAITMERDPVHARALVEEVKAEADETLSTLRDLARGIYPPLLAQMGLVSALEAQTRKATLPVTVEAGYVGRYSQEVESTAYFCCLEALQNVQKYAGATTAVVTLEEIDGCLTFAVRDDGMGFDVARVSRGAGLQNIVDRLEAVGGEATLESAPGGGATVGGRVPISSERGQAA